MVKYNPQDEDIGTMDETIDSVIEKDKETASLWSEHFGGFYSLEGVCRLLGYEGKPLSEKYVLKRKDLLALKTGSGQIVYPRFQFDGRTPIPGIQKVIKALPEYLISRWTVASWFVSHTVVCWENEKRVEYKPIDLLKEGRIKEVVSEAQDWAWRLNQ